MRRSFLLLLILLAGLPTSGCASYDAFCQRLGTGTSDSYSRADKRQRDQAQAAEPD